MPPDLQTTGPANISAAAPAGMPRSSDPQPQDGGRAQRRRDFDVQIGKFANIPVFRIKEGPQVKNLQSWPKVLGTHSKNMRQIGHL